MATGLQVWNPSGQIILDTNDRIGRVLGSVFTGGVNGSTSHPELASGTPFAATLLTSPFETAIGPYVYFVGTTMFWDYGSFPGMGTMNALLIYGVF